VVDSAHGGTPPIQTRNPGGDLGGCAVDPTTGNLAVTRMEPTLGSQGHGAVLVYPGATGAPTTYYSMQMETYTYCAYDHSGNLYVNGNNRQSGNYQLAELPAGQKKFTLLTLSKRPKTNLTLGGVQWDGKNIVIGNDRTASPLQCLPREDHRCKGSDNRINDARGLAFGP
jgi:hypothetical protein